MSNTSNHVQADLDAEELFRLGLKCSTDNDSANALGYLKAAVQKDPTHAQAHWLLGAEYAQLGIMDRAKESMARSIELAPELSGARFQFGLLQLTSGEIDAAADIWAPLDSLPDDNPYKTFKQGLLHMVKDEFVAALDCIRRALTQPLADAALKKDMEMVIGQIEAVQAANAASGNAVADTAPEEEKSQQDQLQFTAYRNNERRH